MRVFKATYKDRKGKTRESSKWYVELRHKDTVCRLPAFKDKASSEEFGRKVERLSACRTAEELPPPELSRWVDSLPSNTLAVLARMKILDSRRLASSKALKEHVEDFKLSLVAKGSSELHAIQTAKRVEFLTDACGFRFFTDITGDKVESKLQEMRNGPSPVSIQTSNYYLGAIKHFCRWMVRDRRASESALEHLRPLNARLDTNRRERRALTTDEQRRLVDASERGPERFGMSGPERAMLYLLALETGLRAGELRSLTRSSFHLDTTPPTVTVAAGYSKRRREDTCYLKASTANALESFLRVLLPSAQVFRMPHPVKLVAMLREDLTAAGIEHETDEGVLDFHGLRHAFITSLTQAKVDPRTIQTLARHSTITLTMDRYAHSVRSDEVAGIQRLPDLTSPDSMRARATGTDGPTVLASCLASEGRSVSIGVDNRGPIGALQGHSEPSTALSAGIANPLFPGSNPGAASNPLLSPAQGVASIDDAPREQGAEPCLGVLLGVLDRESPELALVARSWPSLPQALRAAVLAIVRSTSTDST